MRNLLALLAAACAPPPVECTGDGVRLTEPATEAECQAFLSAWEHGKDVLRSRLPMTDKMLQGTTVRPTALPWYSPEAGQVVAGLAFCGQNHIDVATSGLPWCATALLHEQLHLVECRNDADANHADWGEWKQKLVDDERCVP